MYSEVYTRPDDQDASPNSGYNEAVDIWSVGCLAGTLLTNAFLFPREWTGHSRTFAPDDSADLTMAFNLKFLDTSRDWQGASRKCKSFIRGCAMVDGSQRLTVAQALQHPWVAHPSFAAEMHAEYARAIADWTPRANPNDLIEYITPPLPTTKTRHDARLNQEVRSHHFPTPAAPVNTQFKAFNASVRASKLHQMQLSAIKDQNMQTHQSSSRNDVVAAASTDTNQLADAEISKPHEDEDMSYLSIKKYAPPVIYPVPMTDTDTPDDLVRGKWATKLAESMDLDRQAVTGNVTLPRKKIRV